MRNNLLCLLIFCLLGCTQSSNEQGFSDDVSQQNDVKLSPKPYKIVGEKTNQSLGQLIYAPVYSHVRWFDDQRDFLMESILSIRNTDLQHAIQITEVRYYNSDGKELRRYIDNPITLGALATKEYIIHRKDKEGGMGANFIVEWKSEKPVNEPMIEVVMVGIMGPNGMAFTSPGKVLINQSPKPKTE
jgi:hypothetical protein